MSEPVAARLSSQEESCSTWLGGEGGQRGGHSGGGGTRGLAAWLCAKGMPGGSPLPCHTSQLRALPIELKFSFHPCLPNSMEKLRSIQETRCPAWKGAFLAMWKSVGGSSLSISWPLSGSKDAGAPEESYASTRSKSLSLGMASREGGGRRESMELLAFPPDHTSLGMPQGLLSWVSLALPELRGPMSKGLPSRQ